jgi:hypothetical protein
VVYTGFSAGLENPTVLLAFTGNKEKSMPDQRTEIRHSVKRLQIIEDSRGRSGANLYLL